MKNSRKMYIAAAACIGIGIILTAGGIMAGGKPGVSVDSDGIHMLGDQKSEDYVLEKTKLEEFSSAEIHLDYGNFYLIPSDGYYLEYCLSADSQKPEYEVNNGTFVFRERPVVNYIQFRVMEFDVADIHRENYVNLYVPEDVYFENFVLKNGSGSAEFEEVKGETIELNLDYGNLTGDVIQGETLDLVLESGNLKVDELTGTEKMKVSMAYGDLTAETLNAQGDGNLDLDSGNLSVDSCLAGSMKMNLEYGNIKIGSMKGDSLAVDSSSGDVTIGELTLKESCICNLEYGDAKIGLGDAISGYTVKLDTEYGKITAPDTGSFRAEDGVESFRQEGAGNKKLEINCSSGDIVITSYES